MANNFRNIVVKKNTKQFENKEYSKKHYEDTFTLLKTNLKFVGIRLTQNDTSFNRMFWYCWYWFEFANAVAMAILITLFIVDAVKRSNYDNIFDIFKMTPCVGYLFLSMTKSYKIVYHRPLFENLVSELRDMWPVGVVPKQEDAILQRMLRQLNYVARYYTYMNVLFGIMAFIPPYVELLKEALGQHFDRVLPFFYLLPFDPFANEYYIVMTLIQSWQGWVGMWMIVCGDLLLFVLLSHITAQFDLLSVRITQVIPVSVDKQLVKSFPLAEYVEGFESKENLSNGEREEMQLNELKQIILRHNALIRLTQDLDNMYSFSLLVHFINASIIICFSGFCGVFIEKLNEPLFKSFFLVNTGQTGLICWYGQRLMESSQGVSNAIYNCGWYTCSKKIMAYILFMLCRSQKEVRITTFGFSVISLTSFTTIVKTAWSYFTMMINMYKG